MSVLLPWDRKKSAGKGQSRERRPTVPGSTGGPAPKVRRRFGYPRAIVTGAIALALAGMILSHLSAPPLETVWEVPGGRLVAASSGAYLVAVGNAFRLMDQSGKVADLGTLNGEPVLGAGAAYLAANGRLVSVTPAGKRTELAPVAQMEQVVSVLDGGTVLTAKPADGGKFGEQWSLVGRASSGAALWSVELPGTPSLVSQRDSRVVVALTDLSSGGLPAVACLDAGTGRIAWIKGLQGQAWRALGILSGGLTVAVLDTCITAIKPAGAVAWSCAPIELITAATIAGDFTCISSPVSRGFTRFVYPYEVRVYAADGTVRWSRGIRQRPAKLQNAGGEALIALAENHVLGFHMRDGERLFAERIAGYPVSLTGDTLLLRDAKGLMLRKFRRPGGIS